MDERYSTLDLTFSALAHPTRRRMMDLLVRERVRVTDLAAQFDCSLNVASRHILSLERAGLITREQQGRVHWLKLNAQPLSIAAAFVERYRELWGRKLDRLAGYLDSMAAAETKTSHASETPASKPKPH